MNLLMFRSTFLFENLPVADDGLVRSRNVILFTTKQRSFLQVAKWMDGWLDGRPKIKMVNGDAVIGHAATRCGTQAATHK